MGGPELTRASIALILVTLVGVVVSAVLLVADAREEEVSVPAPTSTPRPYVSVPLPTPTSVVRDGTEYVVQLISPLDVDVDLDDNRVLLVHVYDEYSARAPECSVFDLSARVVQEDSETVTVATFGYRLENAPDVTCSFITAEGDGPERVLRLRLRAPLAFRRVIDARTGDPFGPS